MKKETGKNPLAMPDASAAPAKSAPSLTSRMALLGIPPQDMTEPVKLALSVLFEKLDDAMHELERCRENFSELERLVDVDCVAPVPNRRAFMRRLAWAVSMFERYEHPCCVLYFDLNNFKQINDTYGHLVGDMAIRHVSELLSDSLRTSDFMARLGGDEFAIIMYYASIKDALLRGEAISQRINLTPFPNGTRSLLVSTAYGAAEVRKGDDPETVLSNADIAMYRNKKKLKSSTADFTA